MDGRGYVKFDTYIVLVSYKRSLSAILATTGATNAEASDTARGTSEGQFQVLNADAIH